MAGYQRKSAGDIVAGAVVKAAPVDTEFNCVRDAFNQSTGHKHDGSSTEGAYVPIIADSDAKNKVCVDTSNNRISFFTEVSSTATEQMRVQDGAIVPVTDDDIDLGITTTNRFKNLFLSGNATVGGTSTVTGNSTFAGTLGVTGVATFSDTVCVPAFKATGTSTLTTVDINAGNIDGTVIGASSAAAGSFTTLSTTGQGTFATVDINGGTVDGAIIGGTTAGAITGTTITGSSFVGPVTGNVTGNITGDVTGDLTGNVTGNVTGDITGDVTGNITGDVTGDVTGNLTGNVTGDVTGGLTGDVTGSVTGNVTGNLTGDVTGNVTGNVTGDLTGNVTGNVTSTSTSTFTALQLTGDMDANTNKITNLADPVSNQDAATKLYVDSSVSNLIDSAPGTLDTLNEIAAAIGDDPDFSTTITTSIAGKLPLAGGTMTGDISLGANKATSTANPVSDDTLSRKGYVDTQDALKLNLTGGTLSGDLTLGTNKATSTATPATADTLSRKGYVDDQDALKLNLTGGTMSGAIAMGTSKITGLGDPTAAQDSSTKAYTDTQRDTRLALSGGTMTGAIDMGAQKITTTYTPTDNADLTTKTYVDGILGSSTDAATSAAAALVSENNAATSETNASNSASAALTSANNAAASYDDFDDRYLGDKSADPSVDNDGDGLITGAIYWNTTDNALRLYSGSSWTPAAFTLGDALTEIIQDTTPQLGGNLDGNSKCITNAANICATNFYGTLTGNVTGDVTGTVSDISNHDTDDLSEGTNQYFTTARVDSHLTGGTGVTYSSGTISVGQAVGTSDNVCFGSVCVGSNPTAACQLATKEYVDTVAAAGIHYHTPVRVEHPTNLTATYNNGSSGVGATLTNSGTQAALILDSVTMVAADRVLVANQTDQTQNGVYTVTNIGSGSTNWVLTRSNDTDSYAPSDPDSFGEGDAFFIKEGSTNAGHLDVMTTSGVITFGTTNIVFSEVAETSIYSAGNGLSLTGTEFTASAGTGVTVNGSGINIGQAVGTSDTVTFARVCAPVTGAVTGNADTASAWATARTVCVCGAVTGSASVNGSGNVCINTTATSDPTLTLNGDVSGSATFTNLGNATLTVTVADDSHNHTVANVDGLATCLAGKAGTNGSLSNNFSANCFCADICAKSPIVCASTKVCAPIVCGTSCLRGQYVYSGGIVCAATCVEAANCVKSGVVCGTTTRGTTACFTDFNSTSDCRCKDNITTVDNAYCKIGSIRGVNYNWKDSGKYTLGVIAQEVEEAFPELVTTDEDGFKAVNYNGLVGVLVETVKCLQGKVEELENGSKG